MDSIYGICKGYGSTVSAARVSTYKMRHFFDFCFFSFSPPVAGGVRDESGSFLKPRSARIILMNIRSTLWSVFADVSMKLQPKARASDSPSTFETALLPTISHLLPININTGFDVFTRSIDCRKVSIRSNVSLDVVE